MSYSLIIVDMQPAFSAAKSKKTIEACKSAIEQAMIDNAGILFVEYIRGQRTLFPLYKLAKNYRHFYTTVKTKDDGGNEVLSAIRHKNLPNKLLKFAGVNTTACVFETIKTVRQYSKADIELLLDACNDCNDDDFVEPVLKELEEMGVELV